MTTMSSLGLIPPPSAATATAIDTNVVMILAILLCAFIFAVLLNSAIRCAAFRTTTAAKAFVASMPTITFSVGLSLPGSGSECVICLSEFEAGERVRVLPQCMHGFHVSFVDRWLKAHSSCPTCGRCLVGGTNNKCDNRGRCVVDPEDPVRIGPLDPEDPVYLL